MFKTDLKLLSGYIEHEHNNIDILIQKILFFFEGKSLQKDQMIVNVVTI